jgi:hypothetical protein
MSSVGEIYLDLPGRWRKPAIKGRPLATRR